MIRIGYNADNDKEKWDKLHKEMREEEDEKNNDSIWGQISM